MGVPESSQKFSALLCLGRCKSLGSLQSFLLFASQLSGASIPSSIFTSCLPWGSPRGVAEVWASFLSALRLTSSHWTTGIIDNCDILVYWYGRKYPTSHHAFQVELRGWKHLRKRKLCLHLIFFHWNTLCYTENLNELWGFYANNQVTDHGIQFLKTSCSTMKVKVKSCPTLWDPMDSRLLRPWDFLGKSTGVGCHFLLQGIFPTQGSNPGLPHWRQTLYRLSHQVAP